MKSRASSKSCLKGFDLWYDATSRMIVGLLICTLISENQSLEKSRSVSNPRKISGSANLHFFSGLHSEKKLSLYYKPEENPGAKPEKK